MLAGHILLKVAAGFGSIILASFNIFFFQNYTVLLILLFFMETAAAFIQAAVFTGLLCIYLNEAFNSH
jgi:F-type H+-transporting ATPase subunit a